MKNIFTYFIKALTLVIILLTVSSFFDKYSKPATVESSKKNTKAYIDELPKIPDELLFCGEEVPLNNIEVKERLERELIVNTYWHSSTILTLKRANRWFPLIEKILKKNNIPDDFKYLAMIESGLDNAISPKYAVGYWQFLKSAGKRYGLVIDKEVDERYNVEKSTEAACKYLQDAYNRFGSWTLAAASYNFGISGIREQLKRQKTDNYYSLVFGEETSRYILRIVAAKQLYKDPISFGFKIPQDELYDAIETYDVKVKGSINHLADFAFKHEITYKTLKYFNPWLRENYLKNKKKRTYLIKIPSDKSLFEIN